LLLHYTGFIYHGPDKKYEDTPICVFFAETEIGTYDMDKKKFISIFGYPNAAYVHQGWVSEDQSTLYVDDEADEECRSGLFGGVAPECNEVYGEGGIAFTNTYIFDISDLENVGNPRIFVNTNAHPAVDHNLYVQGKSIQVYYLS